MNRYVIGFLVAVGMIVLVIILIVRSLVSSPSAPSGPVAQGLPSYAGTATTVQFTIDSPEGAPSAHNDIIINVGNYQATLTITQGYDGQVVSTKSYPMSTSAYATFLKALNYNGFTAGDPSGPKDENGHCALGTRYVYEILDPSGNTLQHFWYTSCGSGTFQGSVAAIHDLFTMQIPDYSTLTSGINNAS